MSASQYDDYVAAEEQHEGPTRFLKFAVSAGAAAAALGAGAMAWRKTHEGASDDLYHRMGADEGGQAVPASQAQSSGKTYVVAKGENLTSIARKMNTTVEILREANSVKGDTILEGQTLWVPKTHTIQKGETLSKIARDNNISVDSILKINSIKNPDAIYADDILLMP